MEDIKNYLQEKDAIAACFRVENKTCRITIATNSQGHLKEIISEWDEVRQDNSDLYYMFRQISFLSREEQIHIIQEEIRKRDATPLIKNEEQRVAEICADNGATQVHYKYYGDKMEFYITGHLDKGLIDQLKQVDKTREHVYMNPPRCRFKITGQEAEEIGAVTPLKAEAVVNAGEQLH